MKEAELRQPRPEQGQEDAPPAAPVPSAAPAPGAEDEPAVLQMNEADQGARPRPSERNPQAGNFL